MRFGRVRLEAFLLSAALAAGLADRAAAADNTVVLIGSSIAAGVGASVPDSAWASRYSRHLGALNPGWKLVSLAVGGYTTFQVLPNGTVNPVGRPTVDTAHNITKALSLKPTRLLISLTGNDISNGYPAAEYEANFDSLRAIATRAGVEVWFTTPTPRTANDAPKRALAKSLRDRMLSRYFPRVIDFYDGLATADGAILADLDSKDGIHPNDKGHAILGARVAAANVPGLAAARTIAILGSSTAAGTGASTYDSAFAGRYAKYLGALNPSWKLVNYAVGGYTTFHIMPNGWKHAAGRPDPDTARNITKVLALKPSALLISMPSNDINNNYPPEEYNANFDSLHAWAGKAGIPVWIATPLPRTPLDAAHRKQLLDLRARILSRFAPRSIDFYDSLGDAEGAYLAAYNSGDGIHTNDRGHKLLYQRVVAANMTGTVVDLGMPYIARGRAAAPTLSWDSRSGMVFRTAVGRFNPLGRYAGPAILPDGIPAAIKPSR